MPRIPHDLLLKAYNISPLLPLTLRPTRDLESARNELRWLLEHVQNLNKLPAVKLKSRHAGFGRAKPLPEPTRQKMELLKLCRRRERGEPIQYILGSQPFGELDIECRPGVLIPRPETEAYTMFLANFLNEKKLPGIDYEDHVKQSEVGKKPNSSRPLKILDICSGSGCISLLLQSMLSNNFKCEVIGLDISQKAINLARKNTKALNPSIRRNIDYQRRDIFDDFLPEDVGGEEFDIVISNPPYISRGGFKKTTARSVRNWEPKTALVPEVRGQEPKLRRKFDRYIFYRRILELNLKVHKSKCLILEVEGKLQATQVVRMALDILRTQWSQGQRNIQIWTDNPSDPQTGVIKIRKPDCYVRVQGSGNYRAVVIFGSGVMPETKQEKISSRLTIAPREEVKIKKKRATKRAIERMGLGENYNRMMKLKPRKGATVGVDDKPRKREKRRGSAVDNPSGLLGLRRR